MNQHEAARVKIPLIPTIGIIEYHFGQVSEDHVNESFCGWCALLHRRTRVDFNQPHAQVLINHEIISEKFKAVLSIVNLILDGH